MPSERNNPVEIGEDVFWIGHFVPDDPFQCHVYLIRNKDESILIDPGSMITFPMVIEKLFKITTLKNIKYIILHHQDPDIVGCYSTLEKIFPTSKRFIVTHWRTETLLKHYKWETPFYIINEHDWKLNTLDRELEFIFTPYAHFPGAFCTFDKKTKILFSSDIFGAIGHNFNFFAQDNEEYYKGVELFHKHYIPSKFILNHILNKIEKKSPKMIAPQHGSIIKEDMIQRLINKMREFECGLYLLDDNETDIFILGKLEHILKRLFNSVISSSDFNIIAENLYNIISNEVLCCVEKIVIVGIYTHLSHNEIFLLEVTDNCINERFVEGELEIKGFSYKQDLTNNNRYIGTIYIFSDELKERDKQFLKILFKHIKTALAVSLEREINYELLEREKQQLQSQVIIDFLTRLYNRHYLFDYLKKVVKQSIRHNFPISLAIIDIDFFKRINDCYGHLTGDKVLKEISKIFKSRFRSSDCVARYGGEEFVILMPFCHLDCAIKKLEEVRKYIETHNFCEKRQLKITISAGVTEYRRGESIKSLLNRADRNLYRAKNTGRNRVAWD